MTHVKAGQRRRAKAPKVRTGCRTCKIRRVKCDEGRPSCHRCASTGRTCDGYGPVASSATPSPPAPLSPRAAYSGQEWRSFQYFHEKTLKQLCSFFPNDFWTSYVLKIASTETSIWHSLIALSSYHELFAEPHRHSEEDDRFALNQYNSSIQQVLCMDRSSQSAHVQLASCILFICVETLRGQIVPVVRLVTLGYRILQAEDALDKTFRPPAADASDRRKLFALARSFLSQVVCQIYVLINDLDPGINAIAANIIESGHSPGPRGYRFATAADAQAVLNSIRLRFDRYDEGAIETARGDLGAWTLAFEALRRRAARSEGRALALLALRRLYLAAELSVNVVRGPVDPMLWDAHRGAFVRMLALAEAALAGDGDGEEEGGGAGGEPQFHMNAGVVPVLYGLVQKSRDRDVRGRALRLLAARERQEGVWSSRMVLGTAMRVVAMEERGLGAPRTCADIPRENRVRTIKVVEKSPGDYTVGFHLYDGWHWEDASAFLT